MFCNKGIRTNYGKPGMIRCFGLGLHESTPRQLLAGVTAAMDNNIPDKEPCPQLRLPMPK